MADNSYLIKIMTLIHRSKSTDPDYIYCQQTQGWEKKDKVIRVNGAGLRFLFHGRGRFGFITYEDGGFTIAKVFTYLKREYCSSYYFNGKPSPDEIRKVLFDSSRHISTIMKRGIRNPYKASCRHAFVPVKDWDKAYNENTIHAKSRIEDKALKSMGNCISFAKDCFEFSSAFPNIAMTRIHREIAKRRKAFIKQIAIDFPIVEIYAIWVNYDPETMYVIGDTYDACEPLIYTFNKFESISEIKRHTL